MILLSHERQCFSRTNKRSARRRPIALEMLEDRFAPAALSVSNTADGGAGSLRQAIADAVASPEADTITFNPSLAGKTIAVNRGTLEDTEVTKVATADADIQRYNDYNGVISAFLYGQAQLMVVGNDFGATILAKNPAIKPVEKFQLLTSPSNMAVKKGETALQQKLNEVLAGMKKDGTLNEMAVKWLKQPLAADF